MEPKNALLRFKLLVVGITLLACSSTVRSMPTPTSTATTAPTETPRPIPTTTPTPFFRVVADQTITMKSGGFSFDHINGYEIYWNQGSSIFMRNSDETVNILLSAYARPSGVTISTLLRNDLKKFSYEYRDFSHTEPVKALEKGINSISADFRATQARVPVQGRFTIYEPEDSKLLFFYVIVYGEQRWEREGQRASELTRDSLNFFRIKASDECLPPKYPEYGQRAQRPIMIGGGESDGPDRIKSYLDVLLGPQEEIISYYRLADSEQDVPGLVLYGIDYGKARKVYYFDIDNYEPLRTPLGMKCSAPFPGNP